QTLFARRGGKGLRARLDAMSYAEYQSLLRVPPAAIRNALVAGADGPDAPIERLLASVDDAELAGLVGDLGGHDLAAILDAFREAEATRRPPTGVRAPTLEG